MELAGRNIKIVNINKLHMFKKAKQNMAMIGREMEEIAYIFIHICITRDAKYQI